MKIRKVLVTIGLLIMIAGAIDPLEGSIAAVAGSAIAFFSTKFNNSFQKAITRLSFAWLAIGVAYLWYISSLGGIQLFSTDSGLPIWCGIPLLLYPLGYLTSFIMSIIFLLKKIQP